MFRTLMMPIAVLMIFAGCSHTHENTVTQTTTPGPMTKPEPTGELARLERFVGSWRGTAELLFPETGAQPQGDEATGAKPTTFAGGSTYAWTLDGMFLRAEGWYETGGGQQQKFVEFITWDPKAGKYHSYMFSNWGEHGESWMTPGGDDKFDVAYSGYDAAGNVKTGLGTMRFMDDNSLEWTWSEKGPQGAISMRGTSQRE